MGMTGTINDQAPGTRSRGPDYHQVASELLETLAPVAARHPEWVDAGVFERFVEPERQIIFRVTWVDDAGQVRVNKGFRVQFNSALGLYCGGTVLHPAMEIDLMKTLALDQTLKNALTGLAIGGAKGGSDFDPAGKSNGEVMRFCQSFVTELQRHIGENTDVPTFDIGTGQREIGYMYGQYRKLTNNYSGALAGKGQNWGGTYCRDRATGFGVGYFMDELLRARGKTLEDATIVISGSGHDAIYSNKKTQMLGAKVVAMSDSAGYIHDPNGIPYDAVKELTVVGGEPISGYLKQHPGATYAEGSDGIWNIPCDVALTCAGPAEIGKKAAAKLVAGGCYAIGEGTESSVTPAASDLLLKNDVVLAPATAVRAGGAAISAFEMSQNSARSRWEWNDVNDELKRTMSLVHRTVCAAAEDYDLGDNLVLGTTIAAFQNIADAMYSLGV